MPKFTYKAKEGPGRIITGFVDAESADLAIQKVIKMGLSPIDVSQGAVENSKPIRIPSKITLKVFKTVSSTELVLFTRQMSDLVDASVPILRALQIVLNQTQNLNFKEVIEQMYLTVKDGKSFSEALARHTNLFSNLYVNMVKSGEVSGQLEVILNRLADYLEKEQELKSKVRSSLAYPALILGVGFLTIIVIVTFVVPRLSMMFDDMNQQLPLPTVILLKVSSFFSNFWWLILTCAVTGGLYLRQWLHSPKGSLWFDSFKLRIPFLSNFIKMIEVARLTRTLATLVESGVPITTALKSVSAMIENQILRDQVKTASDEVSNGSSLKSALQRCNFFPEMAINMVSVGEETGKLDRGLYKIAESYERQSDRIVRTIVSLLGPLVLVVVVSIVGFVVISLLLPILRMNLLVE